MISGKKEETNCWENSSNNIRRVTTVEHMFILLIF
jgi:hypothetical protein